MKTRIRTLVALTIATGWSISTAAVVTGFHVEHGLAVGSTGTFVTNDLFIDFTGRYSGSQVLVTLDTGVINQETNGGSFASSDDLLALFPELAADTYYTQGGYVGQQQYGNPNMIGGPINLAPNGSYATVETPTQVGNAWGITPSAFIVDQTDFQVMRLALSEDANGSFQYFASVESEFFYTLQNNQLGGGALYEIQNGKIVSTGIDPNPEPEPEPEPDPEPEPEPEPIPTPTPTPKPSPGPGGGNPTTVPTPSAFVAGMFGLGLLASRRRRED